MWNEIVKGRQYEVNISQLMNGASKDFIFEMTLDQNLENENLLD